MKLYQTSRQSMFQVGRGSDGDGRLQAQLHVPKRKIA